MQIAQERDEGLVSVGTRSGAALFLGPEEMLRGIGRIRRRDQQFDRGCAGTVAGVRLTGRRFAPDRFALLVPL